MNATNLPKVKYVLRTISKIVKGLLSQVIKLSSAEDVHQKVEEFRTQGISRLFSDRIKRGSENMSLVLYFLRCNNGFVIRFVWCWWRSDYSPSFNFHILKEIFLSILFILQ